MWCPNLVAINCTVFVRYLFFIPPDPDCIHLAAGVPIENILYLGGPNIAFEIYLPASAICIWHAISLFFTSRVLLLHPQFSYTGSEPLLNGSEFNLTGDSQYGIPEMIYDSVENVSKTDAMELKIDGIREGMENSDEAKLKSSLKSSGGKKLAKSATWADGRKTSNKCSLSLARGEAEIILEIFWSKEIFSG